MSNAIGTFFHWRNIGIAGIVCSAYGLLIAIILPESPFWLATKQRYEKCSFTHRWMMGQGKQAEGDLEKLINYQKNLNLETKSKNFELKSFIAGYFSIISSRQFYKPLLLCLIVHSLYIFSGKVVFSVYAIDIISKITAGHHISPYTAMLVLDGVTVLCMYVGCLVAKVLPRKKLLIGSSLVGIFFLLSISLYAYLIKLSLVVENNYFAIFLLIGYSIGLCFGPVILTQTISGELVSIEARGLSSCCMDLSSKVLLGTLVKMSPFLFKSWGTHGAFLFFGLSTSFFSVLIYVFLPETKDMTLQEIAEWMKGNKKSFVQQEEVNFLTTEKI